MPKSYKGKPVGSRPGTPSYPSAFSLHLALHGGGPDLNPANEANQTNEANTHTVSGTEAAANAVGASP
jgi:hypothetical protein